MKASFGGLERIEVEFVSVSAFEGRKVVRKTNFEVNQERANGILNVRKVGSGIGE